MNNISLLGRLGKDPETIKTKNDKTLVKFSIATNDGFGDNKKTNWHNCIAFRKTGEIIAKYVQKGDNLGVNGSVDYSDYEKDGQKKYFTQILVNSFTFVGGKKDQSEIQNPPKTNAPDLNAEDQDYLPF